MSIFASLMRKVLSEQAVYWQFNGHDGYGKPIFSGPVQFKCRWEDVQEQFLDWKGAEQISKSKVYTDRDMLVGSVLWLGLIGDLVSSDPLKNPGAGVIQAFSKVPDLKAQVFLRTAML